MEFEEWFVDHQRWLLRLSTALAGSNEAEDIVQDVAIKAARRWATISVLDHPEAYLRRMVVNEHLSLRRRLGRIVVRSDLVDLGPVPDPADLHGDRALLVDQIRRLPPKQRAVVVLRYVDDLDDVAIAEALGCGRSTVRSHAARALASLRIQLDVASRDNLPMGSEENSDAY